MRNPFLRQVSKPEISGFKGLRQRFIEYTKNPGAYVDLTKPETAYNCYGDKQHGMMTFPCKPMNEVVGIEYLGHGAYSNVYSINDKYVLKVVKSEDSGYERFVALIRQYPNNPYFPRVLYSGDWAGKRVYILEKLESGNEHDSDEMDSYEIRRKRERARKRGERFDEPKPSRRRYLRDLNSQFRDAINSYGRRRNNPFFGGYVDPLLEEAARLLHENSLLSDLHAGNVMFRGDVPVVTDPCCE